MEGGVANVLVSLCKDLLQLALSDITNSSTTPPSDVTGATVNVYNIYENFA